MHAIDVDVLMASCYAIFLALVAAALELLARHSQRWSDKIRTVGFTYYPGLDVWKCPKDRYLYPTESRSDPLVVRYRAEPHHCNSCPIKNLCTDSEEGRVIEVQPDLWLQSELRRFHRGISLTLLLLADVILVLTMFRQNTLGIQIFLAFLLLCLTAAGMRLLPAFINPSAPQLGKAKGTH